MRRRWARLLAGGIALSLVVQLLSNFLPIPKTLPIDDFFRTPGGCLDGRAVRDLYGSGV